MSELFESSEMRRLLARIRSEANNALATNRTAQACASIVKFIDSEASRYALEVIAECNKSLAFGVANQPEPIKCMHCGVPQTTGPIPNGASWAMNQCAKSPQGMHEYLITFSRAGQAERGQ